ncbi:MAG: nucleotidyltransferase domain-containing protein [Deltaproteobacteria bacterium]|nr:nucleotidyltransferase domain-containing protein [Deltaproteobacteria bacterium]
MVSMERIREVAAAIGREFRPLKVILFGSFARGTAGPDSDVDLLVVMRHEGKGHVAATRVRARIRPGFPVDLLVRDPVEIERRLALGDGFIREILEQGIVLYETPHG